MTTLGSLDSLGSTLLPALTLGLPYWVVSLFVFLFLAVCVVLILTVLIQRPQGGGLSGAFGAGGGGSGQTAFGAKTGDALTIATISIFILFLLCAIGLNFAARPANLDTPGQATVAPVEGDTSADGAPTDTPGDAPGDVPGDLPGDATPPADTRDAPVIDDSDVPTDEPAAPATDTP